MPFLGAFGKKVANAQTLAEVGVALTTTPGTATASEPVVLNASKGISTITSATITTLTATTVAASGAITSSGATTTIGYATGAGGAVTQITSASTGVTLSKPCGQITTVALTTAAAAEEAFTVTNTLVAATDVVVVGTTYAGAGTPIVYCKKVAAGSFDIGITNVHAANALDAVVVINFAVIKAVAA